MADQDSEFGAFMSGLLIGGLVGAAIALLLAPQSGEETRTLIREKSIELKDRAAETADDVRARAESTAMEARMRAEEFAQQARSRAEDLSHQAREKAEDLKMRGQAAIEAGKQAMQRTPREEGGESPMESEA